MILKNGIGFLVLAFLLAGIVPSTAMAKSYKQCAVGMFGIGYVAKVKWYHPDNMDKAVREHNVAVGERKCNTSSVPHFMTIRAMGSDTASVFAGFGGGAAAGLLTSGACVVGAVATGGAGAGFCAGLGSVVLETTAGAIINATQDKGVFYGGYAEEVELSGQTWSPDAEVSDYLTTEIPEAYEFKIECSGVKHAGTKSNITVTFYNDGSKVGESTSKGCKNSAYYYSEKTAKVDKVHVTTDGVDAMFIDYARLEAPTKGKPYYWGAKGKKGFCASLNSNDAKSWQKAKKLTPKECFATVEFNREKKKVYGI